MSAQYILSKVKPQLHQVVLQLWERLQEQPDKQLEQEQGLVPELELAQLVEWAEQEWELNQILSLEWVEWVVVVWEEWEAWAECQCSLVWQQVADHLEWAEWVDKTWTHRWLTK